jgi:hypothetical protein
MSERKREKQKGVKREEKIKAGLYLAMGKTVLIFSATSRGKE